MARRWAAVTLGAALLTGGVLVVAPLAPRQPPVGPAPASQETLPAGAVVTMPAGLSDGSSFSIRAVVDIRHVVGESSATDGSTFRVVFVADDRVTVLRELPREDGPSFNVFTLYDGSIYWAETTIMADGVERSQLWAARVVPTVGEAHLVVADLGGILFTGSAHDVIVADDTLSWAVVDGWRFSQTTVRSVPLAGGPLTERTYPGAWRQIARPWLVSNASPTTMLNQETGEQVTVPGSELALTECAPDWCRVTVDSGGDVAWSELVSPDGTRRTRVAGANIGFITIDPATFGRYEILSQIGGDIEPGEHRLLLYDARQRTTTVIETGPLALVSVRGGWAWWLAGDQVDPVWHVLDLAALPG